RRPLCRRPRGARRALLQSPHRRQGTVARRYRAFDPRGIRPGHAAVDGRQERLYQLNHGPQPEGEHVAKVKIEPTLYQRAERAAAAAGYSSVEEFINNCVEKELERLKVDQQETQVSDQLRGLGYLE